MTQHERDAVGMALSKAAVFYDRGDIDKSRISVMIDVILDACPEATADSILSALKTYRDDQKNSVFPSPAKLLPYLRPTVSIDSQAQEIATRIIGAIRKFQDLESQFANARAYVGELGWAAIRKRGGWPSTVEDCFRSNASGQFYAQLRDLVKSQIEISNSGIDPASLLDHKPQVLLEQGPVKDLVLSLVKPNQEGA